MNPTGLQNVTNLVFKNIKYWFFRLHSWDRFLIHETSSFSFSVCCALSGNYITWIEAWFGSWIQKVILWVIQTLSVYCVTLILCSGVKTNREIVWKLLTNGRRVWKSVKHIVFVIDCFYMKTFKVNDLWDHLL